MKKIGIYNPYASILGGGERYILTIAECLSKNYEVHVFWNDPKILRKAEAKFHLDLSKVQVKRWFQSRITRATQLRSYHAFFYVTDGSVFFSGAQKNFLIIQSPDKIPVVNNFLTKAKLATWRQVICYSQFMARIINQRLNKQVSPLFVPVNTELFTANKKRKVILSVGRFFPNLHSKRQDVLIEVFKKMLPNINGWKLILVGSVDPQAEKYFNRIKKQAQGLPIEIYTDVSFHSLVRLYDQATIYWHAAGFGADLHKHPEKAEHFGVTTIEAMAAGAIPVVFGGGGQKEIVQTGKTGYIWKTKDELIKKTLLLMQIKKKRIEMQQNVLQTAQNYSVEKFCLKVYELVQK